MQTKQFDRQQIQNSVIAVPPLARDANHQPSLEENRKIIQHIESGGVRTLLYGGNANFYHVAVSEYESLLSQLAEAAGNDTLVIPSVGPAYGTMMDQAVVLQDFEFPTVMVLPQNEVATSAGIAQGVRDFVEQSQKPIVLYLKHDRVMDIVHARSLVDDGLVSFIKYAVVRPDPSKDSYLSELTNAVDPAIIVSGIGEQPAIVHMQQFGLAGFTSGCVCVAPGLSMRMLAALRASDVETAEKIRKQFEPLEDHRNSINPIRVLHHAVAAASIAETGPLLPLLSDVDASERDVIAQAARELLKLERSN